LIESPHRKETIIPVGAEEMASADYGSGYRAVIKELGEWPSHLGHNSACAGIVTHAAASPASKYISRQQLVQQLLAQMATNDPRGAGRAAAAAGSTVSLESATSSQDESSKMLRNHGNASPTSFDATESCRLSTLVVLGSSGFHEPQTPWRSQTANQKHYEPSKTYEQAGWNPQRVPDQGSSYNDSLGMRRSLSASWENASPAASSRGNTREPKFLPESSTRRQHSRRVPTTTKLMVAKNSTEFRALVQKLTGLKPEICRHELAVGSTDHQQDATPTLEQQELQPMKLQRTATAIGDAAVTPTWWNMSSEEAGLNPAQLQLVTGIHAPHNNNIITTSAMPMDVDEYMVSSAAAAAVAAHEPRFNNSEVPTTTTTGIINTSTTLNDIDHDQINAAVQDHDLLPYSQIEAMWQQQQQQQQLH